MIEYVEGDLFLPLKNKAPDSKVCIAHCCNNQGRMGSGFVVPLAREFPKAKSQYVDWATCRDTQQPFSPFFGNVFELGNVQFVDVENGIIVANMVAQTLGGARPLFYNHLVRCMEKVAAYCIKNEYDLVCPMFGSNLAGGNWQFIEELIKDCWIKRKINVTIHYLPGEFQPNQ